MKLERLPRLVFIACLVVLGSLFDLACGSMQAVEEPATFDVSPVEQSAVVGAPPGGVFAPTPQDPTSTIRFERITAEDGLSQNSVLTILQDRRGFMWFGTEGGLNKYDGGQFTVYKHDLDDPST